MDKPSSESQEFTVSPSVSREKWAVHARNKMGKGFALIVARERKSASFYKEGRPTEPCPYKVARALIESRIVEETGSHFLGTKFVLSSSVPAPPRVVDDDDDDVDDARSDQESGEMEGVLDELEGEATDEEDEVDDAADDDAAVDDEPDDTF